MITARLMRLDGRVTLSEERGRLGLNRVRLDWRLSEIDRRTVRRTQELFGRELSRSGLGRVHSGASAG